MRAVPKPHRAPRNDAYRAFIRSLPCVLWPGETPKCYGYLDIATKRYATQACHLKSRGSGGGDEPGQLWPGCAYHHMLSHTMGRKAFEQRFKLDLKAIGKELYAQFERERGDGE